MPVTPSTNLQVTYRLHCATGEDPAAKAAGIALEQTVELPMACVPDHLRDHWVGQVRQLEPIDANTWRCRIDYAADLVGEHWSQCLNLLFGNISLQDGILIDTIDWPEPVLQRFGGPGFGTHGLRHLAGVSEQRALTCTALKPVGLDADALADRARLFAEAGIDLIKDDHGLADQPAAPFAARLAACQAAVTAANRRTGGSSLYLPNVTAPSRLLDARLAAAHDAGCKAVLLCPWLCGLDSLAHARDRFGLAVMAHPALTGSHFRARHGLTPALLLGEIFRIAGADAVIYPNVGGRFGFTLDTCQSINHNLRRPLGTIRPALPTVGGGMELDQAAEWSQRYGADTILLIGGSLYRHPDLLQAARRFTKSLLAGHS